MLLAVFVLTGLLGPPCFAGFVYVRASRASTQEELTKEQIKEGTKEILSMGYVVSLAAAMMYVLFTFDNRSHIDPDYDDYYYDEHFDYMDQYYTGN